MFTLKSIFEYDEEAHKKLIHQEGYEDGYEDGHDIGLKEGHDVGLKEGHDIGLKEERENGIHVLINLMKDASREEIITNIIRYYSVSWEDAEKYILNP